MTACIAVAGFRTDNSVGIWFAEAVPALEDYRQLFSDFGNREWILVAVEWETAVQEALDSNRDQLAAGFSQLEHVHRVSSSADFQNTSEFVESFLEIGSAKISRIRLSPKIEVLADSVLPSEMPLERRSQI